MGKRVWWEGGNQVSTHAWVTASHRRRHPWEHQEAVRAIVMDRGPVSGRLGSECCLHKVALDTLLNFSETQQPHP